MILRAPLFQSALPCWSSWPEFRIVWRFGGSRYEIVVANPEHRCRGVAVAELDGAMVDPAVIPLVDDGYRVIDAILTYF